MNIVQDDLLTDVLDMFTESESLKCLLPRFASVKRFVSPFGRAYAVHGGEYINPTFTHGLTTWLSMSSDGRDEKLLETFSQKYGVHTKQKLNELADFGTLGHIFTGELMSNGFFDTGFRFAKRVKDYMAEKGLPMYKADECVDLMAMYIYSMSCFIHERNFECYAVEMPVVSWDKKITTCIDAIGEMDEWDAKGNAIGRVTATINFKFRETPACYEKDIHQTNIERFMLQDLIEQGYTKMPYKIQSVDKCYVLCPKKISNRTRDNYLLIDTTDKYTREMWQHNHKTRLLSPNKPLEINLDASFPIYRNARIVSGQKPQRQTLKERLDNMFLD